MLAVGRAKKPRADEAERSLIIEEKEFKHVGGIQMVRSNFRSI